VQSPRILFAHLFLSRSLSSPLHIFFKSTSLPPRPLSLRFLPYLCPSVSLSPLLTTSAFFLPPLYRRPSFSLGRHFFSSSSPSQYCRYDSPPLPPPPLSLTFSVG
jgi:hypothetical protein